MTIPKICYFILWLTKDICKNIKFWPTYSVVMILSSITSNIVDDITGKYIAAMVIGSLSTVCVIYTLKWLIFHPIRRKYEQYKQEQYDLLTTIKGTTKEKTVDEKKENYLKY